MRKKISLLLILLGIVGCAIAGYLVISRPQFIVYNAPVSLSAGHVRSTAFTPDASSGYSIIIYFHDVGDPKFICLIGSGNGYPFYPFKCQKRPILDVMWTVSRGKAIVRSGNSFDNQDAVDAVDPRDHTAARFVGDFRGDAGASYIIDIDVKSDASLLNAYHPHLVIRAFYALAANSGFEIIWTSIASILSLLIGIGLFSRAFSRATISTTRPSPPSSSG